MSHTVRIDITENPPPGLAWGRPRVLPATAIEVTRDTRIQALAEALAMAYAHCRPDIDKLIEQWQQAAPALRTVADAIRNATEPESADEAAA